jgi:hypothetical protein
VYREVQKKGQAKKRSISDLIDNNFTIIKGGGFPGYYDVIKNSIRDVNQLGVVDYLFICVDSEERSYSEKLKELETFIKEECPAVHSGLVLIVQNHCIETWLMGNKRINISSPQNRELLRYRDFYNVNIKDPEGLSSIDGRTIGQFSVDYLKLMLREKGLAYSKNNVSAVDKRVYFNQLVRRFRDDNHIKSFGIFFQELSNISG